MPIKLSTPNRLSGVALACFFCVTISVAHGLAGTTYNVRQIGLTGAGYSYISGGEVYQFSFPFFLNNAGQVGGVTYRFTSSGADLGLDTWLFNGASTVQIGLIGAGYSYNTNGGVYRWSDVTSSGPALNAAGQSAGTSSRYDSTGTYLGEDSWYFNGTGTVLIGLTGSVYSLALVGGMEEDILSQTNDTEEVDGTSTRYGSNGSSLGQDTWLFNGTTTTQIGLTGTGYSYNTGTGVYQDSVPSRLSNGGDVDGITYRYNSSGTTLGQDSWLFNGTSTVQIGLTGTGYNFNVGNGVYESSSVTAPLINNAGQAVGTSNRYFGIAAYGQDTWIFNGTTTVQIGLTGTGYTVGQFESSTPVSLNDAGQVIGYSNRYNTLGYLGQDAWLYNGTTTVQVGQLTGSVYSTNINGVTRSSHPILLNNAGQVAGYSTRYSFNNGSTFGQDSWIFNGTTTVQTGLTGSVYTSSSGTGVYQYSTPSFLNNAGQVVGTSERVTAAFGTSGGQDCWFFNGTSTVPIGPTGTVYGYFNGVGVYQYSSPHSLNDAGKVIGYSNRYNSSGASLGQDGWLYDASQNKTYLLQFSVDSANSDSQTTAEVLLPNGDVLGEYELYNGSTDEGQYAFEWNEVGGFVDLGSLVNGGLSANGWQELATAFMGSGSTADGLPLDIVGTGVSTGGTTDPYSAAYLLTPAVPEPTSIGLVVVACSLAAMRRRRTA